MINYVDIAVIVVAALFLIIGLFKGFVKPLVSLLGWGGSFAGIYFFAGKISDLLLQTKLGDWMTEQMLKVTSDLAHVEQIVNYTGMTVASIAIILVVSIVVAIINVLLNKAFYGRKGVANRIFGGILYLIKSVLFICILMTIIMTILEFIGRQDIIDMFNNGVISKYFVQYNPFKLMFDLVIAK